MIRFTPPIVSTAALAGLMLVLSAGIAAAQSSADYSNYGCTGLETDKEIPSIEGSDGVFYRINADLRMDHPFSDQTVAQMAGLSQALAANGTTLIFVPIPTKSVTMPGYLPKDVERYGFDLEVATEVHLDILRRLDAAGVITVDARDAMIDMPDGELAFFKADFHWSAAGARQTAIAIAEKIRGLPEYADLDLTPFETVPLEVGVAFSGMRRILQRKCLTTLPEAETMTYRTTQIQALDLDIGGLDLFGESASNIPIVLLGTSFSDSSINNFPGFLAEYAQLEVVNYALTGGNQYGSITSYLTSTEFEDSPPRFLVWENPIYNNLAQYGDLPMRELTAAAGRTCTVLLNAVIDAVSASITVELAGYELDPSDTILVDTHENVETQAAFIFQSDDGLTRTKTIERGERLSRTGRFYMPLSGLWDGGAAALRIQMTQPFLSEPSVYVCPFQMKDES
jgi:alginate biosynthesis protein AlgX